MITLRDDPSVDARRGRVGFVLGKECKYFEGGGAVVVRALVEHGFEIHTTAKECEFLQGISVITHGHIDPNECVNSRACRAMCVERWRPCLGSRCRAGVFVCFTALFSSVSASSFCTVLVFHWSLTHSSRYFYLCVCVCECVCVCVCARALV
jgi:hypothetical protein